MRTGAVLPFCNVEQRSHGGELSHSAIESWTASMLIAMNGKVLEERGFFETEIGGHADSAIAG